MKRIIILAMVLAIMAMGMSAYAVPVTVSNGNFRATTTNAADGTEYLLDTNEFHLLGTTEDERILVFADNRFLTVDSQDIQTVITALGLSDSLASMTNYQSLERGDNGEEVASLQRNLIALGFMSGTADGDFGGISEGAITRAQEVYGQEETGVADPQLQMLLQSMTEAMRYCSLEDAVVGSQFDAISGKTDANLDKAIELNLNLKYDDIYGVGRISNGATVYYTVPTESDIDKRAFNVTFALALSQGADGMIAIAPVMDLECTGAQRPSMQEVTLKSGDERQTLVISSLENSLSGLNAVEKATIPLDDATVQMLANIVEEGELKLRVVCKYTSYDILVGVDKLQKIAEIAQTAQTLY